MSASPLFFSSSNAARHLWERRRWWGKGGLAHTLAGCPRRGSSHPLCSAGAGPQAWRAPPNWRYNAVLSQPLQTSPHMWKVPNVSISITVRKPLGDSCSAGERKLPAAGRRGGCREWRRGGRASWKLQRGRARSAAGGRPDAGPRCTWRAAAGCVPGGPGAAAPTSAVHQDVQPPKLGRALSHHALAVLETPHISLHGGRRRWRGGGGSVAAAAHARSHRPCCQPHLHVVCRHALCSQSRTSILEHLHDRRGEQTC